MALRGADFFTTGGYGALEQSPADLLSLEDS